MMEPPHVLSFAKVSKMSTIKGSGSEETNEDKIELIRRQTRTLNKYIDLP